MDKRTALRWLIGLCWLVSGALASEPVVLTGRTMGTTWTVKWVQPVASLDPTQVSGHVAKQLDRLEQIFSTYRRYSEISRFNDAATVNWGSASPEMARLAMQAAELSRLTVGAFDVTVHPLVQLWGFGGRRREGVPSLVEISVLRERVDWRRLEFQVSPPALRKTHAELSIDFSSLAKGYAADVVGEMLTALGAPNHLVMVGGDARTGGDGPVGAGWRLAVEDPGGKEGVFAAAVALKGEALATAGNHRNFFEVDGRRYGHIIDPRTGWPVAGDLLAVSVVAADAATASSRATALFVLGSGEGWWMALREKWACFFMMRGEDGTLVRRATAEFERHMPRF